MAIKNLFKEKNTNEKIKLASPLKGYVKDIKECIDDVFAKEVVGHGVFIIPYEGKLYAPVAGTISMLADREHAVTIDTDNGAHVLIHVGIDTVELEGKPFSAKVTKGDRVEMGDLLIEFDLDSIENGGKSLETPLVITNHTDYIIEPLAFGRVEVGEDILLIKNQ